jgi:hypothetical protein
LRLRHLIFEMMVLKEGAERGDGVRERIDMKYGGYREIRP